MTQETVASGTTDQTSGLEQETTQEQQAPETVVTEAKKDQVAYDTYRKVLSEKKKVQARLDELENLQKDREVKDLESQKKWQELAKLKEDELKKTQERLNSLESNLLQGQKLTSFLEAIPGEVPKKFWSLIELDEIIMDPETQTPDELSLRKAVETFTSQYSDVIQKAGGPRLPNEAPGKATGTLTYEQWKQLPPDEMKQRMGEVMTTDN